MSRIAIIDMGTNTFHLLLAELVPGGHRILHRDHVAVKIGMAGINEGFITESGCQRAIAAMRRFREIIDRHGVSAVYAFGTSALRNAKNGPALAEEISTQTGIPVEIISGEAEADLIFAGVRSAVDLSNDVSLIMDIGAGSVEFIIGAGDNVVWKQSFEIGGQRLLEKFQKNDPITPEEIGSLNHFFHGSLNTLRTALDKFQPKTLIGSSGTFDTLSEIYCLRENITITAEDSETPLSIEGFYLIYDELIRKNRSERMNIPGMIELRVDMIVVCCCLIHYVLDIHPFDGIRVSTYSLKEGALARAEGVGGRGYRDIRV